MVDGGLDRPEGTNFGNKCNSEWVLSVNRSRNWLVARNDEVCLRQYEIVVDLKMGRNLIPRNLRIDQGTVAGFRVAEN